MGETTQCPLCGVEYTNAELHQRVHEIADEDVRQIDHDVDERVDRREREQGGA